MVCVCVMYAVEVLSVLLVLCGPASLQVLQNEPIDHLYAHTRSIAEKHSSPWRDSLLERGIRASPFFEAALQAVDDASVILSFRDEFHLKHMSPGTALNSTLTFPDETMLAVMGTSLNILLEGYQSKVFESHIGKVLKGQDKQKPVFSDYKKNSLQELLTSLPAGDVSFGGLREYSRVASEFLKCVIGGSFKEALEDALISVGLEEAKMTENKLVVKVEDLVSFATTVGHLFDTPPSPPSRPLPLSQHRYLFGWWVNCGGQGSKSGAAAASCLVPSAPTDALVSLSPALQVYVSPSLRIALVILLRDPVDDVEQVLEQNENVWRLLLSGLVPEQPTVTTGEEQPIQPSTAHGEQSHGAGDSHRGPTGDQQRGPTGDRKHSTGTPLGGEGATSGQKQDPSSGDDKKYGTSTPPDKEFVARSEEKSVSEDQEQTNPTAEQKYITRTPLEKSDDSKDDGKQQTIEPTGSETPAHSWKDFIFPMTFFLFFIFSSHVWVYWMFHLTWMGFAKLFGRTPRPKTAKGKEHVKED